jgi:homoserine acetyltransferase
MKILVTALLAAAAVLPGAGDGEQQFARIGDLKLTSGEVIRDCTIGYRTYGKLNAARSNAIVFPTWFSGRTENLAAYAGSSNITIRDMVNSQHRLLTGHLGISPRPTCCCGARNWPSSSRRPIAAATNAMR